MIELGPKFTRAAVNPWPGMSAQDTIIWLRALEVVTQPGDTIYYNVRLGPQRVTSMFVPPEIERQWQQVNAKRIDLVIQRPGQWIIVEVRHIATSAALGRLIQYKKLWLNDWPERVPDLLLVTDWMDPDLPELLGIAGISYLVI
jgi:hypothetical protein